MSVFELSRQFPKTETYSLTDQIRRSSRSVATNIAEAWRKRRYETAFIAKLSDSETEAAETQSWLEFTVRCGYATPEQIEPLERDYEIIIGMLVNMMNHPEKWVLPKPPRT